MLTIIRNQRCTMTYTILRVVLITMDLQFHPYLLSIELMASPFNIDDM